MFVLRCQWLIATGLMLLATMTAEANTPSYQLWHTVTLSFDGPATSETASDNPFTNRRLLVTFVHEGEREGRRRTLRGFYAADGHAADTGADSGAVWQVRFAPDQPGVWSYTAALSAGANIALSRDGSAGVRLPLANARGSFTVTASDKAAPDFRQRDRGLLVADRGYFRFARSGRAWLKGGTNSPENLLGYADFDGTFRMAGVQQQSSADAGAMLHHYAPHLPDWQPGDPVWRGGKGKGLVGALNYLAATGMNSVYFLTLNILGDGKDVWPYRDPADVSRFDVSKLEQWERVFEHMQAKGLLLHMVTQEAENERLLDDGDTGPQRQLYYQELIARFAHHPGLVWNLGEENGPVDWRPAGQSDAQRRAMMAFFKAADPYGHPVVLHTHAEMKDKTSILTPLLGVAGLDGLSFQVGDRQAVNHDIRAWRTLAASARRDWLITMDEVGPWHSGAVPDAVDAAHDMLRRHVLWGSLLGGAAGVEWYFGYNFPHNDLTSDDWRQRDALWAQTRLALSFFQDHLPYAKMHPCNDATRRADVFCLGTAGKIYALYVPAGGDSLTLDMPPAGKRFSIRWYDPLRGGGLQPGSVRGFSGSGRQRLGLPPSADHDWVALVRAE
jgi:hypothetical protein